MSPNQKFMRPTTVFIVILGKKKWWGPNKSGESRTHLDELQVHLFTIQRKTRYVKIF